MLTSGMLTEREEIPHEPGQWMRFRYLGWKQVKAARDAKTKQAMDLAKDVGPEFLNALRERADAVTPPVAVAAAADPLADYDQATLLRLGIGEWSYGEFTPDDTDNLDEGTAEWAARRIAELNRPPTAEERQKN